MILDKKLQLASNMSIGVSGRDFTGCKTSTDKININALRDFGRGEQAYVCVTVKSDFTITAASWFGLSLCAEHLASISTITTVGNSNAATGLLYHRIQPRLAFSGYIPGNITNIPGNIINTENNAVAGKKFVMPISPLTHYSTSIAGKYIASGNVYFMFEEFDSTDPTLNPSDNITSGSIDVDIVTLAESGAGPGFNDQVYFISNMKVS